MVSGGKRTSFMLVITDPFQDATEPNNILTGGTASGLDGTYVIYESFDRSEDAVASSACLSGCRSTG
jgi:hypothetical protein